MPKISAPVSLVTARSIGVEPALIRGEEVQGLMYFTWDDAPVAGAQCAKCNEVIWVDQRLDEILNERKPIDVPESGPGYRAYKEEKIR